MFFDSEILFKYGPRLLDGMVLTLQIVGLGVLLGGLIAVPTAMARTASSPLLNVPARVYIFFFRGTPLLAQAFLIYFGLGQFGEFFQSIGLWWFFRDAFWCGILALSLNTGAYTAEILRGGINAVESGLIDAGKSLGMPGWMRFRLIIFPIAFRYALPAYGNEIILTIKGSAVLSIITLTELMGQTRLVFSRTLALEVFLYAAVLYLCLTLTLAKLLAYLEFRQNRHQYVGPNAKSKKPQPLF